jgi:heme/copper-type cytochrome/quinol oxidase subunit 2
MNAKLPQPVHESYRRHRRQVGWQIILPMVLSVVLCIALIVLIGFATFRDGGDVARWAAISTIWIVVPIMIGLVIVFALLAGLVYLMARLLKIAPNYTALAQDYAHKAAGYIKRGADAAVKPVFFVDGLGASIRAFFGRK